MRRRGSTQRRQQSKRPGPWSHGWDLRKNLGINIHRVELCCITSIQNHHFLQLLFTYLSPIPRLERRLRVGKNWVGFAIRTVTMRSKDRHSVYIRRVNEYMNETAAHSPLTSHSTPADMQITQLFSVMWEEQGAAPSSAGRCSQSATNSRGGRQPAALFLFLWNLLLDT